MQGSGGLESPEPGGDDKDSVVSVTDSEGSEEEKVGGWWYVPPSSEMFQRMRLTRGQKCSTALKTTLGDGVAMARRWLMDLRHFETQIYVISDDQLGGYMPIFSPDTRCFEISETRMLGIYL